MHLCCPGADEERFRNLSVRQSLAHESEHLVLSRREEGVISLRTAAERNVCPTREIKVVRTPQERLDSSWIRRMRRQHLEEGWMRANSRDQRIPRVVFLS